MMPFRSGVLRDQTEVRRRHRGDRASRAAEAVVEFISSADSAPLN